MELRLLVVQGKPLGKEIPVASPRFLIGRSPECHMRPNSELVSRVHCQFSIEGDQVLLRDMGSSNGTLVNGERLTSEVPLNDGDMVQVGPLGFQVILERSAAAVVAETPIAAAAAVPASPQTVPAGPPEKLGNKDAKADDIHGWLLSDSKNVVPDSGSGVYKGDTQMMNVSEVLKDTQPDATATTPAEGVKKVEEQEEQADKVVEAEGGVKIKIGSAKQKIEKTRDDTSQAASDILRRMMERRPKR